MISVNQPFDVAIIGAGLAGLTCGSKLLEKGYNVVIIEKSRGLGGRLATRRIDHTCVDHGLSYMLEQGELTRNLIERLRQETLIQSLSPKAYQLRTTLEKISSDPYYFSLQGMTFIAKYLAKNLNIWRNCRVINLIPTQENYWHINFETSEDKPNFLTSKILISAIPAPQLLLLLKASHLGQFPPYFLETLQQVSYYPCLSVIAGYSDVSIENLSWDNVRILSHPDLAWVGIESVKRETSPSSIFVLHSTPYYAEQFLDHTDLQPLGKNLLNQAAQLLFSPLKNPSWYQVHRWRYAIPHQSIPVSCLSVDTPLPLIACGDWCSHHNNIKEAWHLEKAMNSGLAAAKHLENLINPT